MILRNFTTRHGRKVAAQQVQRACLRALSTETTTIENPVDRFAIPPARSQATSEVAENYRQFKTFKKRTAKLGAAVAGHYEPYQLVANPPSPRDITLELLMASQSHLGHATSLWNPGNQRYIYGIRQGIHIISLEVTAAYLRRAAKVVEGVAYHGGLILFVGTRPGQSSCVVRAAGLAKGCHLFERWIPGSITNGEQILSNCGIQAVDPLDQPIEGYEEKLSDWKALKPDLVVCLNPLENYVLLHECGLNNIPTIGIIDTDADPTWVTYPIPANDDRFSLRCVQLIASILGRAGEEGNKKRLEAAKSGKVTWTPPSDLGPPVTAKEREEKLQKRMSKRASKAKEAEEEQAAEKQPRLRSLIDEEDL
ncbi:ribosomal protein S2, flavodoxin-like domain-containing protein [Xylogone sp. PMI_703]|nr:ribosomal protein S2, flavodoxin-like domain-containing protein [Xylogone sp. PMI_703]